MLPKVSSKSHLCIPQRAYHQQCMQLFRCKDAGTSYSPAKVGSDA